MSPAGKRSIEDTSDVPTQDHKRTKIVQEGPAASGSNGGDTSDNGDKSSDDAGVSGGADANDEGDVDGDDSGDNDNGDDGDDDEDGDDEEDDGKQYEYLDHTADIQIHSWGDDLGEAFAQATLGMFDYITELEHVEIDPSYDRTVSASGHDLKSLLYNFMDEWLYVFSVDGMCPKQIEVVEFDKTTFKIVASGRGEKFDLAKHPQGTEVKAITYSAMQILEEQLHLAYPCEVFVIVDI